MQLKAVGGRVGAVLWILCLQFFAVEQVVARSWTTSYSFARNYVSDLGAEHCWIYSGRVVCSPFHAWMNASFVLQGLLIFGGALLVRRVFAPGLGYILGLGLLAVSGLGALVVGLAPEDTNAVLHASGAAVHFVGGGLGMIALGVMLVRDARRSPSGGWISVGLGAASLAASILLGLQGTAVWAALGWPVGIVERVPAYGIPLWVAGMGVYSLRLAPDRR